MLVGAISRSQKDIHYFPGFCIVCGKKRQDVEPDACEYPCSSRTCHGSCTVYGAEELLFYVQA